MFKEFKGKSKFTLNRLGKSFISDVDGIITVEEEDLIQEVAEGVTFEELLNNVGFGLITEEKVKVPKITEEKVKVAV